MYFPPTARDFWENDNRYRDPSFLQDPEFWAQMLEIKLYIANQLKRAGAHDRMLLGTDSGIPLVLPGFAIHDELRLMVRGEWLSRDDLQARLDELADRWK